MLALGIQRINLTGYMPQIHLEIIQTLSGCLVCKKTDLNVSSPCFLQFVLGSTVCVGFLLFDDYVCGVTKAKAIRLTNTRKKGSLLLPGRMLALLLASPSSSAPPLPSLASPLCLLPAPLK